MDHLQSLKEILALQDSFNKKVNPNWRSAGYKFYRAAYFEMVEFAEHMNSWKWWKANNPGDWGQAILELVDTFHFVLSDAILHNYNEEVILGSYKTALRRVRKVRPTSENLYEDIDDFVEMTLTRSRTDSGIPLAEFFDVVLTAGANLDDLIKGYITKNVLNVFRQDHGYKQGTYIKTWGFDDIGGAQEDNHFLEIFADELGSDLSFANLTAKLEEKYQQVLQASKV